MVRKQQQRKKQLQKQKVTAPLMGCPEDDSTLLECIGAQSTFEKYDEARAHREGRAVLEQITLEAMPADLRAQVTPGMLGSMLDSICAPKGGYRFNIEALAGGLAAATSEGTRQCSGSCKRSLSISQFSKTQLKKRGAARCSQCACDRAQQAPHAPSATPRHALRADAQPFVCPGYATQSPKMPSMMERAAMGYSSDEDEDAGECGFSAAECDELMAQGVRPWDSDANEVLAALSYY
jgi:hypothetical protein